MLFTSLVLAWLGLTQTATCGTTHYLWPEDRAHGTPTEVEHLETWLQLSPDAQRPLLTSAEITQHNLSHQVTEGAWKDLLGPDFVLPDPMRELSERFDSMDSRLHEGEYHLFPEGYDTHASITQRMTQAKWLAEPQLHLLSQAADLRCIPTATGIYRTPRDLAFDRNQCSRLEAGEWLQVLATAEGGWVYARAGFVIGWMQSPELSHAFTKADASRWDSAPPLVVTGDYVPARLSTGEVVFLRLGQHFPLLDSTEDEFVLAWPSVDGAEMAFVPQHYLKATAPFTLGEIHLGFPDFSRANVLSVLFARLGDPYGWGGLFAARDCSGLLLDAFSAFGLRLGRNSRIQAQAGSLQGDLAPLTEAAKREQLRQANAKGLVLTFMPGHIMLHLGEYEGKPYALSAISEYVLPCDSKNSRTIRIDRVAVTDYERGRATSRTSFLERIRAFAQFGL